MDRGIETLAKVASVREEYRRELCPYLPGHLAKCRPKDVPQRAEKVLVAVDGENKEAFIEVVEKRMGDMKPSQERRLRRVLREAEGR